MASDLEVGNERTPLLRQNRRSHLQQEQDEEAFSIIASTVTKEEQQLAGSTVGERLPYNDYTTIDWLHDLVLTTSPNFRTTKYSLTFHPGQRLIPSPLSPVTSWSSPRTAFPLRRMLWLDRRNRHRRTYRLCSICRRRCRSHGIRLERGILFWSRISKPRGVL